jgi:hypothetical protein
LLLLCRQDCLRDQPALLAATPDVRVNLSALAAFTEAYPSDKLQDTGEERLWNGPFFAPAAGTLDGWLLDHWFTGAAQYDALFLQNFSSASEVGPVYPPGVAMHVQVNFGRSEHKSRQPFFCDS